MPFNAVTPVSNSSYDVYRRGGPKPMLTLPYQWDPVSYVPISPNVTASGWTITATTPNTTGGSHYTTTTLDGLGRTAW